MAFQQPQPQPQLNEQLGDHQLPQQDLPPPPSTPASSLDRQPQSAGAALPGVPARFIHAIGHAQAQNSGRPPVLYQPMTPPQRYVPPPTHHFSMAPPRPPQLQHMPQAPTGWAATTGMSVGAPIRTPGQVLSMLGPTRMAPPAPVHFPRASKGIAFDALCQHSLQTKAHLAQPQLEGAIHVPETLQFGQMCVKDPQEMTLEEADKLRTSETRTITITNTTDAIITVMALYPYPRTLSLEWDRTLFPRDLSAQESMQLEVSLRYPYKEKEEEKGATDGNDLFVRTLREALGEANEEEEDRPSFVIDDRGIGIFAGFVMVHAMSPLVPPVLHSPKICFVHHTPVPFSGSFYREATFAPNLFAKEHVPEHLRSLQDASVMDHVMIPRKHLTGVSAGQHFDPYKWLCPRVTTKDVDMARATLASLPEQHVSVYSQGLHAMQKDDLVTLANRFASALVLEEWEQKQEAHKHTRYNAVFEVVAPRGVRAPITSEAAERVRDSLKEKGANTFTVEVCVPGLKDGRPRVLLGDVVLIRFGASMPEVVGVVVAPVKRRQEGEGHEAPKQLWGLQLAVASEAWDYLTLPENAMVFPYAKAHFANMRRSVTLEELAHTPMHFLVPTAQDMRSADKVNLHDIDNFFDRRVNREQQEAVCAAVARAKLLDVGRCSNLPPLVIHGPPGTGKTLTLVECIRQLLADPLRPEDTRVLAVAPSNTAADVILGRLADTEVGTPGPRGERRMLRVNSCQRDQATMAQPGNLSVRFAKHSPTSRGYDLPTLEELGRVRVVVCTCDVVGDLLDCGVTPGFFADILFDETAQAMEPEVWTALRLATAATNVVIAGDHCQLGPRVLSEEARQARLHVSWQERLLLRPAYKTCTNPLFKCTLLRNFRSHTRLLDVPSELFYSGNLIPTAPAAITDAALNWHQLSERKGAPLLFHGVDGVMHVDFESNSLYNPAEAETIARLVKDLIMDQKVRIAPQDVGVIAPFRHQVALIRAHLRRQQLRDVDVGCIEDFQGKERAAIFISTVITPTNLGGGSDLEEAPILQKNAPFNVAITRAQALLVVVGHSDRLYEMHQWRYFLNHMRQFGTMKGHLCDSLQPEVSLGEGSRIERDPILNHDLGDGVDDM